MSASLRNIFNEAVAMADAAELENSVAPLKQRIPELEAQLKTKD